MPLEILNKVERDRITEAIRAAEASTAGEIYVVVAKEADEFLFIPVLWAALIALLFPWPVHFLTYWPTWLILTQQVGAFVAIALVASHPKLRHRIVPAGIASAAARRSARALFMAHGVHLTEARTGLLIYVALADRRVEIVADVGISNKVDQGTWDKVAQQIAQAAGDNVLVEGLISAVIRVGALLAQHCPQGKVDHNELPDRVVEI